LQKKHCAKDRCGPRLKLVPSHNVFLSEQSLFNLKRTLSARSFFVDLCLVTMSPTERKERHPLPEAATPFGIAAVGRQTAVIALETELSGFLPCLRLSVFRTQAGRQAKAATPVFQVKMGSGGVALRPGLSGVGGDVGVAQSWVSTLERAADTLKGEPPTLPADDGLA
jgi:hypothetical protein